MRFADCGREGDAKDRSRPRPEDADSTAGSPATRCHERPNDESSSQADWRSSVTEGERESSPEG
jgi:hypothetical protein